MEDCSAAGTSGELVEAALRSLHVCGFVALQSIFTPALVSALAASYAALRPDELPQAPLLNGRLEQILPFQPPFIDWLLEKQLPALWPLVTGYLGDAIDLDALTVVRAPAPTEMQQWHRDVMEGPGATLTVHVPLSEIPKQSGGALALQPATHLSDGRECNATSQQMQPHVPLGSAIVYDARACHCGTANTLTPAGRPILYLLLRRRGKYYTGYESFRIRLRFGATGLVTVQRYRDAFRRWRGEAGDRNCETANASLHTVAVPLDEGRPWYLRPEA